MRHTYDPASEPLHIYVKFQLLPVESPTSLLTWILFSNGTFWCWIYMNRGFKGGSHNLRVLEMGGQGLLRTPSHAGPNSSSFVLLSSLELRHKYEPASEPLHISVKFRLLPIESSLSFWHECGSRMAPFVTEYIWLEVSKVAATTWGYWKRSRPTWHTLACRFHHSSSSI